MAQHNQGFSQAPSAPPSYSEMNIPGEVQPQSQNMMYSQPQGQNMMYSQPQGQNMMLNQPKDQRVNCNQRQGSPVMYCQQPTGINLQRQPQQMIVWMERPVISGCPPGLEYLTRIDQLHVKQHIELLEVMTGYETNNKYSVKNAFGQTIYHAKEDSDFCDRYCCGANRPFIIRISDNLNYEIIRVRRPYKCHLFGHCCNCAECCQDEVVVEAPPGNVVGYVKQIHEDCNVRYLILDEKRDSVMRIHGPHYCQCYCPGDSYPLALMSGNGEVEVGRISKEWSNLVQEYFTDADNFGIQFPMDLDVRMKAVVLGAVFLIDFMFFENNQASRQRRY